MYQRIGCPDGSFDGLYNIKFYHLWHAIVLGYTCRSVLRLAQHTWKDDDKER